MILWLSSFSPKYYNSHCLRRNYLRRISIICCCVTKQSKNVVAENGYCWFSLWLCGSAVGAWGRHWTCRTPSGICHKAALPPLPGLVHLLTTYWPRTVRGSMEVMLLEAQAERDPSCLLLLQSPLKASEEASPDSEGGEVDTTFDRRNRQNQLREQEGFGEGWGIMIIFAIYRIGQALA